MQTAKDVARRNRESGKYACATCGQSFASKAVLDNHLTSQKHADAEAGVVRTPSEHPVTALLRKVKESGKLSCDACKLSFADRSKLQAHLDSAKHLAKAGPDAPVQTVPPREFAQTVTAKRSRALMQKHKEAGDIVCVPCGDVPFGSGFLLERHLKTAKHATNVFNAEHGIVLPDPKAVRRCDVCGKNFATNQQGKLHLLAPNHLNAVAAAEAAKKSSIGLDGGPVGGTSAERAIWPEDGVVADSEFEDEEFEDEDEDAGEEDDGEGDEDEDFVVRGGKRLRLA